jgi:transcriptional regulator with XRE-family HTH domain
VRNRIKELRIKQGISVDKLAEMCGLSRSTVIKAEKQYIQTSRVGVGTFNQIAKALGVTLVELIDASEDVDANTQKAINTRMKNFSKEKIRALKQMAKSLDLDIEVKDESNGE